MTTNSDGCDNNTSLPCGRCVCQAYSAVCFRNGVGFFCVCVFFHTQQFNALYFSLFGTELPAFKKFNNKQTNRHELTHARMHAHTHTHTLWIFDPMSMMGTHRMGTVNLVIIYYYYYYYYYCYYYYYYYHYLFNVSVSSRCASYNISESLKTISSTQKASTIHYDTQDSPHPHPHPHPYRYKAKTELTTTTTTTTVSTKI